MGGEKPDRSSAYTVLGGLAALATVHVLIVVPAILSDVREIVDEAIDRHASRPHEDAVSHREIGLIVDRLEAIEKLLRER